MVTRDQIIVALRAIERALDERIELRRTVIDRDGVVRRRIYRGSFRRTLHPKTSILTKEK